MTKESGGCLTGPGAKRHLLNFEHEKVFLVRAILVIITLYICSALGC